MLAHSRADHLSLSVGGKAVKETATAGCLKIRLTATT
jgi:hypothetical protein